MTSSSEPAAQSREEFEVASIRPASNNFASSNIPLDSGDSYQAHGNLFRAIMPLMAYIKFAYKLNLDSDQVDEALKGQPKWATSSYFAINARAPGVPTKDQLRSMIRSLLEDRFKLKLHFETFERKAAVLQVGNTRTVGPFLKAYASGQTCGAGLTGTPLAEVWKAQRISTGSCGTVTFGSGPSHERTMAGRAVSMGSTASSLATPLEETVLDKTGLTGIYDFLVSWDPGPSAAADAIDREGDNGASLIQAIKYQLGLKVVWEKTPVVVLKIDHIEEPKGN